MLHKDAAFSARVAIVAFLFAASVIIAGLFGAGIGRFLDDVRGIPATVEVRYATN